MFKHLAWEYRVYLHWQSCIKILFAMTSSRIQCLTPCTIFSWVSWSIFMTSCGSAHPVLLLSLAFKGHWMLYIVQLQSLMIGAANHGHCCLLLAGKVNISTACTSFFSTVLITSLSCFHLLTHHKLRSGRISHCTSVLPFSTASFLMTAGFTLCDLCELYGCCVPHWLVHH